MDLNLVNVLVSTNNIHSPSCHKDWDLHWSLTTVVQHSNLLLMLNVELFSDTRGNTQVFIVDYNNIKFTRSL